FIHLSGAHIGNGWSHFWHKWSKNWQRAELTLARVELWDGNIQHSNKLLSTLFSILNKLLKS
ncbi:hypothetical protein, partial [Globicatella sanguinis]